MVVTGTLQPLALIPAIYFFLHMFPSFSYRHESPLHSKYPVDKGVAVDSQQVVMMIILSRVDVSVSETYENGMENCGPPR